MNQNQLHILVKTLENADNVFIYINYSKGKIKLYRDIPPDSPLGYYYLGHVENIITDFSLDFENKLKFWLDFDNPKESFDFIFNNKRYSVLKTKLFSKILNNQLTPEFKRFVLVELQQIYPVYCEYCISVFVKNVYMECLNTK